MKLFGIGFFCFQLNLKVSQEEKEINPKNKHQNAAKVS